MVVDGTNQQVEQQYIRGIEVDKTIKGYAEIEYTFKEECEVSSLSGDAIRWYQEEFGDLTATSPMRIANVAALATPTRLNKEWTRNTSYTRKYIVEGFISDEDIRTADIDTLGRTLRAFMRAVLKQTDTRIFNVMTNSLAGVTAAVTDCNLVTSSGAWTDGAANPIRDVLAAQRVIWVSGGYNAKNASLLLTPTSYENLVSWLIFAKGSSIPQYASDKITSGTIMQFMGLNVKVSPNITADYAVVVVPKLAVTWKTAQAITSNVTDDPGIGKRIRVWEDGEAILTAPKAVCIISNVE